MVRVEGDVAALVCRAQAGDEIAAEELLGRYRPLLAASIARHGKQLAGGAMSEEDLWQEAYRHFLALLRGYRGDAYGFGAYLKQMLGWRIANYVRAERRRQQLSETLRAEHLDLLVDELPQEPVPLLNPRLRSATRALSPRQKGVLYGLYWEGRAVREVAKAMGLTSQAVSALRKRAEEQLRQELLPREREQNRPVERETTANDWPADEAVP